MSDLPAGLQKDFARDALAENYARELLDYWLEARGTADLPPVSAIDPTRLPSASLPFLSVIEVEQPSQRLRARLSGTALVEQMGMDQAGFYLDEIPGIAVQLIRMNWCVQQQKPYLATDRITFAPKDFKQYQILVLPFGDATAGVQRLVGVFCFLDGFNRISSWTT